MSINVVVVDKLRGGNNAAYNPIYVWRNMKPIDPNWKGNNDGADVTWIVWVVMAIVAVVVVVVVFFWKHKRTGYKKLEELLHQVKQQRKHQEGIQAPKIEVGGLEDSGH